MAGVWTVRGVLGQAFCAGLGVICTKSEKSNACDGVCGLPYDDRSPPPPGVVIMEEGSARDFWGGVEGGCIRARDTGLAGDGEVARYSRRSAPSSPDLPFFSLFRRPALERLRIGGGVRGGDDRMLKECAGSVFSSSSDTAAKFSEISSGLSEVPG